MKEHELAVVDGGANGTAPLPDRQPMTLAAWEGTVRELAPNEEQDIAEVKSPLARALSTLLHRDRAGQQGGPSSRWPNTKRSTVSRTCSTTPRAT